MRREALWEWIRGALWILPTVAVVMALGIGLVLSRIEVSSTRWFVFQGTPDDARTLLIAISSTLATVIALVLGLIVVALQLASTQFSPRLLRNFLRDRTNQVVLSVFVATFTYSTAGLFTVGVSAGQRMEDYTRLAVSFALVLLVDDLTWRGGKAPPHREYKCAFGGAGSTGEWPNFQTGSMTSNGRRRLGEVLGVRRSRRCQSTG